jgi:membrane-bound ClpP family serine protease
MGTLLAAEGVFLALLGVSLAMASGYAPYWAVVLGCCGAILLVVGMLMRRRTNWS